MAGYKLNITLKLKTKHNYNNYRFVSFDDKLINQAMCMYLNGHQAMCMYLNGQLILLKCVSMPGPILACLHQSGGGRVPVLH